MNRSLYMGRKIRNGIFLSLSVFAALFGLVWLALILGDLCYNGFGSINLTLFTEMTPPPASEGGGGDRQAFGDAAPAAAAFVERHVSAPPAH